MDLNAADIEVVLTDPDRAAEKIDRFCKTYKDCFCLQLEDHVKKSSVDLLLELIASVQGLFSDNYVNVAHLALNALRIFSRDPYCTLVLSTASFVTVVFSYTGVGSTAINDKISLEACRVLLNVLYQANMAQVIFIEQEKVKAIIEFFLRPAFLTSCCYDVQTYLLKILYLLLALHEAARMQAMSVGALFGIVQLIITIQETGRNLVCYCL